MAPHGIVTQIKGDLVFRRIIEQIDGQFALSFHVNDFLGA